MKESLMSGRWKEIQASYRDGYELKKEKQHQIGPPKKNTIKTDLKQKVYPVPSMLTQISYL